jgi:hypothetical protein
MGDLFTPTHLILLLILFVPMMAIHFAPTIVAGARHARSFWWIVVINVFLGWTLIGWIVALVWALRDDVEYRQSYMPPPLQS